MFTDVSEMLAASVIRAIMEAASTSKTSVNFYQTTRRNNPEDNYPHTRRRENLKSHYKSCALVCLWLREQTNYSNKMWK
jgi:hypothetical protein